MSRTASGECAVVLTAGYGSRLFPVTAVVQKSLMPVGNRPVLHYLLADLVAAGVRDIAIVVDQGDRAIRQYVSGAPEVATDLERRGWQRKFEPFAAAYAELSAARFTIIEQDVSSGDYGTAAPARLARDFVGNRSCFYLSGDDLLIGAKGVGNADDLADLRAAAQHHWAAMQVATVAPELAGRYGMVEVVADNDGHRMGSLVEKTGTAGGTQANISRYYLKSQAFELVSTQQPNPTTGEVMITDTLLAIRDRDAVGVSISRGRYFDCGALDGWHQANRALLERGGRGTVDLLTGIG